MRKVRQKYGTIRQNAGIYGASALTAQAVRGRITQLHDPSRMVKKLEWIEMAQLAVASILFKSLSIKFP